MLDNILLSQIPLEKLADAVALSLQPFIREELRRVSGAMAPTDEILNIDEAAKLLGLSKPTVYASNSIPKMKKGNRLYFLKSQLVDYLKTGKKKSIIDINNEIDQVIKENYLK